MKEKICPPTKSVSDVGMKNGGYKTITTPKDVQGKVVSSGSETGKIF